MMRVQSAASFHLEIDGISSAAFVRCAGLGARAGVLEYAEGGHGIRRFPGDVSFTNLVLERGVVTDRDLHAWFARGDRRDGAVILVSAGGAEVARWAFERAWPCRWEGPLLDAMSDAAAIEVLEIVHEGLRWVER